MLKGEGGGEQIYHKTKLLALFLVLKILPKFYSLYKNFQSYIKNVKFSIYLERDCLKNENLKKNGRMDKISKKNQKNAPI